jgi:Uma2 family endonuclease
MQRFYTEAMATLVAPITVKEWLALPTVESDGQTELIDGEIVSMAKTNSLHEKTKNRIAKALFGHMASHPLGEVYVETAFELDEDFAPQPDVAVLIPDRPANADAPFRGGPELVFEVVSSEEARHLQRKVDKYFSSGSQVVVAVYPDIPMFWVMTPDGLAKRLNLGDTFTAPTLLPGFELPLKSLFPTE